MCDVLGTVPEIEKFTVYPNPKEGEDVDKIKITIPNVSSVPVLKALGAAGLTRGSKEPHASPNAPSLEFNYAVIPWHTKDIKTLGFRDIKALNPNP